MEANTTVEFFSQRFLKIEGVSNNIHYVNLDDIVTVTDQTSETMLCLRNGHVLRVPGHHAARILELLGAEILTF